MLQERVSQDLRMLLQRESALEAKMQTLQTMLYVYSVVIRVK